jgi:hypothetical protein
MDSQAVDEAQAPPVKAISIDNSASLALETPTFDQALKPDVVGISNGRKFHFEIHRTTQHSHQEPGIPSAKFKIRGNFDLLSAFDGKTYALFDLRELLQRLSTRELIFLDHRLDLFNQYERYSISDLVLTFTELANWLQVVGGLTVSFINDPNRTVDLENPARQADRRIMRFNENMTYHVPVKENYLYTRNVIGQERFSSPGQLLFNLRSTNVASTLPIQTRTVVTVTGVLKFKTPSVIENFPITPSVFIVVSADKTAGTLSKQGTNLQASVVLTINGIPMGWAGRANFIQSTTASFDVKIPDTEDTMHYTTAFRFFRIDGRIVTFPAPNLDDILYVTDDEVPFTNFTLTSVDSGPGQQKHAVTMPVLILSFNK